MNYQNKRFADAGRSSTWISRFCATGMICLLASATGCTSLLSPMTGIPVAQLPPQLLGENRSNRVNVPPVMLAIAPNQDYRLDEGDILGVYIDGVLPFTTPTSVPVPPPIHFPDADSTLPPSIGYPIAVQADGMLNLPLIKPLDVKGLTIEEARLKIGKRYSDEQILSNDEIVPIVTLIKERTYNVTVIREQAGSTQARVDGTAIGRDLKLPAYQNDVLHALTQTGGLPGFNERNEVTIYKTSRIPLDRRNEILMQLSSDVGICGSIAANCCLDSNSTLGGFAGMNGLIEDNFVITIPLRVRPGEVPNIRPIDIELSEGDIVLVKSRDTEFFYTGGLLQGGQFPLPRDYDLDVLGAMALAGRGVASSGGGGGGFGGMQGLGGATPSLLFIIRKLPCGRTYNIAVDLQLAMNNSTENILVQPGDTLILRNKPHEEMLNFGIGTFFTFGIAQLFNGNRN